MKIKSSFGLCFGLFAVIIAIAFYSQSNKTKDECITQMALLFGAGLATVIIPLLTQTGTIDFAKSI